MDLRSKLVIGLLGLVGGIANAGYAQLAPPTGWVAGTGPGGTMRGGIIAANDALGGGWRGTSAVLNAGGRQVTMPAAYRLASNAGRFAARGLALNPGLLAAAGIAWLATECIGRQGGAWVLTCGGGSTPQVSDGYYYEVSSVTPVGTHYATVGEACAAGKAYAETILAQSVTTVYCNYPEAEGMRFHPQSGNDVAFNLYRFPNSACPVGWYVTPAGCVQTAPPSTVTPQQVEDIMAPKPVPDALPGELPGIQLPIEIPSINPEPGSPNSPRPLWVPQGAPVPVPNSNPQSYSQPGLRVNPAPSTSSPWQVDVSPENRIGTSPDGVTNPESGEGVPGEPAEEGLCEKYPDILACQKVVLGPVDAVPVANENKEMAITKDDGYGPSNASCPAPQTAVIMGTTYSFPWTLFCNFASMIRPLMIGFAWLSAALTFMGLSRKD